jgi:hypothetical protein
LSIGERFKNLVPDRLDVVPQTSLCGVWIAGSKRMHNSFMVARERFEV